MNGKKNVAIAVAVTICLMSAMFAFRAYGGLPYDPWWDLNDDGKIDVKDLARVSGAFGTFGQKINKSQVLYDSGWLDISDKEGKYFEVTHNLGIANWNNPNITMEITGRTTANGPILRPSGLVEFNQTASYVVPAKAIIQNIWGGYVICLDTGSSTNLGCLKFSSSGACWDSFVYGVKTGTCMSVLQKQFPFDKTYVGAGFTNTQGAGGSDAWLFQMDDGFGYMMWNKTYGGANDDFAYSMVMASDGGFALAGTTWSYTAWPDMYLVKTDENGNMQWSKHYGGDAYEGANSVIQTSDGGYALAGFTSSYPAGDLNGYLVKTDASGNMLWNKTYGGTGEQYLCSVVQTSDGGYALAGSTRPVGFFYNLWLIKTDSSGNIQWSKTYGLSTQAELTNSMIMTSDGGFALAGNTTTPARGWDVFFVKTDSLGNMQWNKTVGGTGDDSAHSLIQANDGGYVMAGNIYRSGWQCDYLVKLNPMRANVQCLSYGPNTLTFYRDNADTEWNYLRVQIIKRK